VRTLRRDLIRVSEACGELHPGLVDVDAIEILDGTQRAVPLSEVYGYKPGWGQPSAQERAIVSELMGAVAPRGGSAVEPETTSGPGRV